MNYSMKNITIWSFWAMCLFLPIKGFSFNLEGTISETGYVNLTWDAQLNDTIAGYQVQSSVEPTGDFFAVNDRVLTEGRFGQTIDLNTLNEKIFYKVVALSFDFKEVENSEILALDLPDILPPSAPIITDLVNLDNGLVLKWLPSASTDVKSYEIYKRIRGNANWEKLATQNASDSTLHFLDTTSVTGVFYEYTLRAKDATRLYSDYTFPKVAKKLYPIDLLKIRAVEVTQSDQRNFINIEWQFDPPEELPPGGRFYKFILYKSYGTANVTTLETFDANSFQYSDYDLSEGSLMNYGVKVVFNNGYAGPMSTIQSVLID